MKRKNKLIIFSLIIIIIAGAGIVLYKNYSSNIDSNSYLSSSDESEKSFVYHGNDKSSKNSKSFDFKKFDGKWTLMKFTSNKGNKIIIHDNTKITKGKFYTVVLDSGHNIVAKKDELKDNGDIHFITPKDDKYFIRIAGDNADGSFNISLSSKNNIGIFHIDFFD